jgi:type IV pilus assembly protein PilE
MTITAAERQSEHRTSKIQSGFTLIELMIVVVIIGVLAAIAYPSYQDQARKTRRADAKAALMELASRQEKYFAQCSTYTTNITGAYPASEGSCGAAAGLGFAATQSADKNYNVSIALTATGYTVTATAASVSQLKDTGCTTMTLTATGARTPATGCW